MEAIGNNNVFDYIVVEEAFRRISQKQPAVPCAININPSTFEHGDQFFGYVERLRGVYEIDPSKIILEILETEPISDYERFNEILARFRSKGYSIAVDDFHPIGNHNIFFVDNLSEIDTVKFDGIYMCDVYEHRGEESVTQELKDTLTKIIDKHPHIDFVVEKIENEAMFKCFRKFFENFGIAEKVSYQGYHFDNSVQQTIFFSP